MIWPNDVPPEVATQMQKGAAAAPAPAAAPEPAAKPSAKKGKTKLAAVGESQPPKSVRPRRGEAAKPSPEADGVKPAADPPAKPSDAERGPGKPRREAVPAALALATPRAPEGEAEAPKPSAPPARSEAPGRKPRRELPPYLRVVK